MFTEVEKFPESSVKKPKFVISGQEIPMVGHSSKCPPRKSGKIVTVVLDMDQTSLDAVLSKDAGVPADLTTWDSRKKIADGAIVHLRPGIQDFLQALVGFPEIEVVIWTAAVDAMAQRYLQALHREESIALCDYVIYRDIDEWAKDNKVVIEGEEFAVEIFKNLDRLIRGDLNRGEGTIFIVDDNIKCCEKFNLNRAIRVLPFFYSECDSTAEREPFFFELLKSFLAVYDDFIPKVEKKREEKMDPMYLVEKILQRCKPINLIDLSFLQPSLTSSKSIADELSSCAPVFEQQSHRPQCEFFRVHSSSPSSKLASEWEEREETESRTGVHTELQEDSSTGSTEQLSSSVLDVASDSEEENPRSVWAPIVLRVLAELEAKTLFEKKHARLRENEPFKFFRNTKVQNHWSLIDILKHACMEENRSRKVCVQLNWLQADGTLSEHAPEFIKIVYHEVVYSTELPVNLAPRSKM